MAKKKPDRSIIHKWAATGAATAAVLPAPKDAIVLCEEEVLMVIQVASHFGHAISQKTASQALTTGALGTFVGTTLFETLNIGYPFTIPVKIVVAASVIEALGQYTYTFYENGGTL